MQQENMQLQTSNERLLTRNEKLVEKIVQVNEWVEKEKVKNQGLQSEILRVESHIQKLELSGDSAKEFVAQLKAEKEYFSEKLEESNSIIEVQSEKISELGIIVKKVNVECFFKYMEGNSEDEAKIYLTKSGVAKRYLSHFADKKPDVFFEFNINDYMFEEGSERVDFKLFTEEGIEVYSTSKAVSKGILRFVVPNKNFQLGKSYFITLFSGPDNLLINDMYEFSISK
jgi:seryl-tRNA synthetase